MKKFRKALVCLLLIFCMVAEAAPISATATTETEAVTESADTAAVGDGALQVTAKLPSAADKFTDVKPDNWFYDAVCYVSENGIFNGTSKTTFTPGGFMTRAMVVTVLARMAGIDETEYAGASGFSDVKQGSWYAPSVAWAAKYGIVLGTGNGRFSPDNYVTRQEMATMFVRYFTIFGVSLGDQNLTGSVPNDLDYAADWAKESILVLWQRGLLRGDGNGAVNPKRSMTRAECATLCTRIHQTVGDWKTQPGESPWVPVKPGTGETYRVTFLNADGNYITTMTARKGLGLGAENVPYYAHPDPDNGNYFWGWFFYSEEEGKMRLFNTLYPYNKDMSVFALCGTEGEIVEYLEDECYIIEEKVKTDFVVTIRPLEQGTEFYPDYDLAVYANEYDRRITYTVKPQENGDYQIIVENYKPGVTYTMALNSAFVFIETTTGNALDPMIRYIEFTVEKPINTQLYFRDDIVWLPTSDAVFYNQLGSAPGFGVERAADDTETELGTSIFSYNPDTCEYHYEVGTVICVYSDDKVTLHNADGDPVEVQRLAPNERDYDEAAYEGFGYTYADLYDGTHDAFYIVTETSQSTDFRISCTYRELNSDEISRILYVPDVIPFLVEALPDRTLGTVGTVENYAGYDADLYAGYSGAKTPSPRIGDFLVLYTPEIEYYGEQDFAAIRAGEYNGEIPYVFAEITEVDGMKLTYQVTTADEAVSAMDYIDDYYVERFIPENLQPAITDEDIAQFTQQTEELLDEETIRAFLTTAIEEDAKQGSEDAQEALDILKNNEISFGAEKRSVGGEYADDSKLIQVTGKKVATDIDTSHLSYIPNTNGKWNLSLNIGMMLIVKLRLREGANLYYTISANFTQEVSIGLSASGRFDVKWYLFVPVPKHVEFSLSATADSATDVTLDIRHYTIDKSHMGKISLYGRQADAQEMWENFQDFLLTDAFVSHGAALYSKEAEYYALVAEALAIPEKEVNARADAELAVRLKAKEINAMWDNGEYGLDRAWNLYYKQGGSVEWSQMQEDAAKKAAFEAKDELVANVINISQHLGPIEGLVNKFTTDAADSTEKAAKELADLNPDGTETEEWKSAQKALEDAKEKARSLRESNIKYMNGVFDVIDQKFRDVQGALNAAITSLETVCAQMRLDAEQNAPAIEKMEKIVSGVRDTLNIITTARKLVTCVRDLLNAVSGVVKLANKDFDDCWNAIGEGYEIIKSLSFALKDCKLVLADLQSSYFKKGDGDYERCQEGIDWILKITEFSDIGMELFHTLAIIVDSKPHSAESTDGITNVPVTSQYWKFRSIRLVDFEEFSLNTEVLNKLNTPDEGLNDENIKEIADKYAQMCAITNTWMDLYRKEIASVDVPIFPGLDANIGADFVVQANINVAANFNFHIDYGKEFRIKVDIIHWDISTSTIDRGNQKLSVSLIAMGTLGLRTGFEIKVGLKIIKIFTVSTTIEIMPYVNLYAYVLFQYNRDLKNGDSETKLKGAMYIDIGVHIGFNLALKMDILVYKNTWKWDLWNKNISLIDIGERRNVYNFGYLQPSVEALLDGMEDAKKAVSGTDEEKSAVNTETDGILIVNPATGYKLPASARYMSYMDMTNGALGKVSFDAGHYEYKFFTVPAKNDGNTYPVENNLPLYYQLEEVPLLDEEGHIVYEENDGEGIPLEITVDIDESDFEENRVIAVNDGTPVTHMVPSDKLVIDVEGIEAGRYVEDTHFTADKNGVITYTPDDAAPGSTYAQEVYVYIEWKEGTLEVSNYPIRRLLHIVWTNENPITWLYNEVILVEKNRVTGGDDTYVVWSDTALKGMASVYISPLAEVLNAIDPSAVIYDREKTTYVGSADNEGTAIIQPQENMTFYISADLKDYSLEVRGLNADGTARNEIYSEEYGYKLPIPDTFTPQVKTVDEEGHPKYLKFAGYLAMQDNEGMEETWTGKWDSPIDTALATDLTDEHIQRYLSAVYEDETVKAVFTFEGAAHEEITQYLRRGSAPDMASVEKTIDSMKAEAAAQGKTLQVEWSETPGTLVSDTEYYIYCHTTFIASPKAEQVGTEFKVRLTANTAGLTPDDNDVITFGFVPNTGEATQIKWLPQGVDTVEVDPGVEYLYYVRLTDGDSLERTYSAPTVKTISGEREDTGYWTVLKVSSDAANPQTPLLVTVKLKYTTGTFSEGQQIMLTPGKTEQLTISSLYTPDRIGSVYVLAADPDGEPVGNSYKIICSGTSSNETESWRSKNVTLYFGSGETDWKFGKITFTKVK